MCSRIKEDKPKGSESQTKEAPTAQVRGNWHTEVIIAKNYSRLMKRIDEFMVI